jgi:deoxyribodipyrimidine photolyase-related protein
MTTTVSIVFPHQIFKDNPALDKHRRVFLVEDDLYFTYQRFHKMKLILHRASMTFYADYLRNKGFKVTYVDSDEYVDLISFCKKNLSDENIKEIHFCDPVDNYLEKRLNKIAEKCNAKTIEYPSPAFINSKDLNEKFLGKEKKHYRLGDYYKKQRLHHDILITNGKPMQGQWSMDEKNRKSLPKNYTAPSPNFPQENQYVIKAVEYVNKHFGDNPGDTRPFLYPITFDDAEKLLEDFLDFRFNDFGPYQDALSSDQPFLNHSLLSSSLNCGILTPAFVIEKSIDYAQENNINFSSLEGFIRQIIGWREFIRAIYERHGVEQRNANFWNANNKINGQLLDDIKPLHQVQQKAKNCAYAHHIERLMVLGNFFTLAEIHPDEIYNYFMTYYIDAYDWVMVPNVYGMSTFADGGMMSTKPYISSSNYLLKMGASKSGDWTSLWDALYWRFLYVNRSFFASNHRTKMMTYHLDKMGEEKLEKHLKKAADFLKLLK